MKMIQAGLLFLATALGSLAWSKAGISIFGGLGLLVWLTSPRARIPRTKLPFLTPLALWLISFGLSSIIGGNSQGAIEEWGTLWPLGFLFVTAGITKNAPKPQNFLYLFLFLAALGGIYSIGQFLDWLPPNRKWPGHYSGITHIWAFSVAMTTAFPLAIDLAFRHTGKIRKFACLAALLSLAGLIGAQEKANLLVGVGLGVLVAFIHKGHEKTTWMTVSFMLAALCTGLAYSSGRLADLWSLDLQQTLNPIRIMHWTAAWDAFLDSPLLGHGIGNYPLVAAAHPEFGEKLAPFVLNGGHIRCHNLPLQILATQGLLGFIPFLWLAWSLLKPFLHSWKNFGQAEVLGICAWLIHAGTSITDTPTFQSVRLGAFTLLSGFALGLLLSKESAEMK